MDSPERRFQRSGRRMIGRGEGRGWYPHAASNKQQPQPQPLPPLPPPDTSQKHLRIIRADEISKFTDNSESSKVKDCQYVASYNWLEKKDAAILVPGLPPTWCPPSNVSKLPQDNPDGTYYRDQNAARYPSYPVDPAVRAIFELNPEYSSSDVDVFACASILGSLMSFVKEKEERTFRFGVERIGNTIFLVRKTNQPKEVIDGIYGYGHTFPEAYTSWDESVKGSASNQRIISYNLGGLKCLVRSECDGVLSDGVPDKTSKYGKPNLNVEVNADLTDGLENLLTSQIPVAGSGPPGVIHAGRTIPQCSVFDLKTLSIKKRQSHDFEVLLSRYWINQTPNAVIGWHTDGTFHDVEIKDVREKVKTWEEKNAVVIRGLCSLLQTLIQFSNRPDQSRFEVRRTDYGPLEIWSEVKGWSALPNELKARWTGESLATYTEQEDHQDTSSDSESETADYLKF